MSHCTETGEARKAAALALLESHREAAILQARRALLQALLESGEATADDVRLAVELPEGVGPKCLGCVPVPLARLGIIAAVGFSKSTRPEAHARPVQVWRLADRPAALAWLRANPEPCEPPALAPAFTQPTLFDVAEVYR